MTLTERKIWHLPLILLLAFWLGSCSMQYDGEPEPVQKFTLRVHLNTNAVPTRATDVEWGDHYNGDDGSLFENRISKVDIFLLDANGISSSRLVATRDTTFEKDNVYVFQLYGNTPGVTYDESTNTLTFNGRIMAVANVTSDDSWQASNIPYEMNYGEEGWLIPMWGIEEYNNVTLDANKITDLTDEGYDEIYMLRAVSKIIIRLDDKTSVREDYKITSIKMKQGSPLLFGEGYTLPNDAINTHSTKSLGLEECFFPKETAAKIEEPKYVKVKDFEDFEWYTYVSESETDTDTPFAFEVTLESQHEDRPHITGILNFSNYENYVEISTITNVVRNHVYEFTIRLAELQLLPSVKEWVFEKKEHIEL